MKYKVFVSQPMNGRTAEEILSARKKAIASATHFVEETMADAFDDVEVEILDSYFESESGVVQNPLYCLGKSLCLMSQADLVYFTPDYETARGCRIEFECAVEYGLNIVVDYKKWQERF